MNHSEHVKTWRRRTKARLVESMGGKCVKCDYDKCDTAFDFHHIDPTVKDFAFGGARANPTSWSRLVEELRKCILLCSNCHREYHAGALDISGLSCPFNEKYADYKQLVRDEKKKVCPICLQLKHFTGITCSISCAASRKGKVDWETYNPVELKKQGLSNVAIAEMAGCSEMAVRKRIKKMAP